MSLEPCADEHDPYLTGLLFHAVGDGARVEAPVLLIGSTELPQFFRGLYDDFRGWEGDRVWRSLEDELRVTAHHDGHVHLRWELSCARWRETSWTFSTVTQHGAGEDMRRTPTRSRSC
ncbi:DUF6228 family protein [Luteimicrobium subarcticum]|uniref:DUF6228 family protein n=1 Tax=Luteimicrobium subarcticum TaxID=620910 RepID=UPI003CCBC2F2